MLSNLVKEVLANRIALYRQPIVAVATGEVSHYEILVRFVEGGRHIAPTALLEDLERHHYIELLDLMVLKTLVNHICQEGDTTLYSVNISGQTINESRDYVWELSQTLKSFRKMRLIIEVTETELLNQTELVQSTLAFLRSAKNLELAIDDFGHRYSNLTALDLGAKYIKIHGKYSSRMPQPTALADVSAIVGMAHARSAETVLEWVELREQLEWARKLGVDYVQGYLTGRPEPLIEICGPCKDCHESCPLTLHE